ncbi:MAG TPA: hypothetical protein VGR24_01885, partial [bacterium]|nr:hypothetical protein [bacterium]
MRKAETAVAALLTLFALGMIREATKLSVGVAVTGVIILTQSLRAPRTADGDAAFIPPRAWKPLLIVFLPMV